VSTITKTLSLIPLSVLNEVLVQGHHDVEPDKAIAVAKIEQLIDAGIVTLDQVKATKPSAINRTGAVSDDVRKDINRALSDVDAIRTTANNALDNALQIQTKIDKDFAKLTDRLNAKLSSVGQTASVDIAQEVSKVFEKFRKTEPAQRITEIANALPVFQIKKARDVFDGVLSYEYAGEVVDFSDFEVGVWNDPDAPARVDDYVFNPQHLHQALIALDDPLPDNVWLAGERGTGKTEFVAQLASRLGRKLFRVNFDEALERAEFIGGNTIENSNVVWKAGVITQAIQHTGAIVLLDEIGFARAQNLAVLHALCERSPHRSIVIAETGKRIPVASHVVFFGADNSNGHGDTSGNFAGVRDQNTAFLDRFSYTLRFEYLPADDEINLVCNRTGLNRDAGEILIKFANVAREKARAGILTQPPSLRQLFAWARAIQKGAPVAVAFENAIVNKFPADCESELRGVFSATIDIANLKSFLIK
jgi:MoxR-like ATPase